MGYNSPIKVVIDVMFPHIEWSSQCTSVQTIIAFHAGGRVRTLREVITKVENTYYLPSTNDSMSPFQIEHYHKYSNSTLLW